MERLSGKHAIWQDLSAFRLPEGFRGRPAWLVQLWWIVQSTLFGCSPQAFYGWRRLLLRSFGADIGRKVSVRPTVRVTFPWKVKIGDYSWIGDNATLYSLARINIGSHVVISQNSYICTGNHDHQKITFDIFGEEIWIGDEVWIASDVFIAPGLRIGQGAFIKARSSVFSDIPEGVIAMGSPARVVGRRTKPSESIA